MSDFADSFDAEMAAPSLIIKEAGAYPGMLQAFKTETSKAGPLLAAFSAVPDAMESVSAYKGLRQVAKDKAGPAIDEAGNAISTEEHAEQLKKKKKELTGSLVEGPVKAVANLATWAIPEIGLPAQLALSVAGPWAAGRLANKAGRMLG